MSRNRFSNARLARMTSDDVPCGLVEVDLGARPVTPAPIDRRTRVVFGGDADRPAPEPSP